MSRWLSHWDEKHRPIVTEIAEQCGFTRIRVIEEVSGASGARTFIVQPTGTLGLPKISVLKIGPKEVVNKDAEGLRMAKSYYEHANYTLFDSLGGDLRALLMDLAGGEGGTTFERFYLSRATGPDDVRTVINDLFKNTLRTGCLNRREERNPFALYRFHEPERHSRALRALGDGLPTLVRWWQHAERISHREPTHTSLCHGDLHRKNIIVAGGSAYVIDFGLMEEMHVMRDFAKLERDICLFLYPADSGSWAPLDVTNLGEPSDVSSGSEDSPLEKARAAVTAVRLASRDVQSEKWVFEYHTALLAQYVFAAGSEEFSRETRVLALGYANELRQTLERISPKLQISDAERVKAHRHDVLWRLAYAFFRLDQLRSGGWAKSLPGWLDALFEGDQGEMPRNPGTRTKGGTDLTSRAFITYLAFLERLGCYERSVDDPPAKGRIAQDVRTSIAGKIGWDGGVGSGIPGRTAIHIRHSIMGLLTLLYISECTGELALDELQRIEPYLMGNLVRWKIDESHPFGCFCILAKVREKLTHMDFRQQWDPDNKLILAVDKALGEMSVALVMAVDRFSLKPEGTCELTWRDFKFRPYAGLWRMERSNLLMYLPLLITKDHGRFHEFLDQRLLDKCALEVASVIRDLAPVPDGQGGLCLYYHRDPKLGGAGRPQDFGLTAELLALLKRSAMRPLIQRFLNWDDRKYNELIEQLDTALERGFDRYHDWPVFKFTHGISFGQYLEVIDADLFNVAAVRALDERIDEISKLSVTEYDLDVLCEYIVEQSFVTCPSCVRPSIPDIRDLLVTKLVSGEHVVRDEAWERRVSEAREGTIKFFNGGGGVGYAKRYAGEPISDFVGGICRLVKPGADRQLRALDIGCGPGQYAQLLVKEGYEVELADASIEMLKIAHRRLNKGGLAAGDTKRIEHLNNYYCLEQFDLIFACAMMVHVPRAIAPTIYRTFHRLLRPGGALFVNFKIGDHSLIGIGDRYFEYYRDYIIPWNMLEEGGFVVREISTRFNHETMYRDPKLIHWANFFCTR
jgi:SAM-dependent methyltransferase